REGRYLGVGFAMYVEGTGMGPFEGATLTLLPSGRVRIATGACSSGQGHRTTYAQIAADVLKVPLESIDVVGGDTASIAYGVGSRASRSTGTAGKAVFAAAELLGKRILEIAAEIMETAASDLELQDGQVRLKGVPGHSVNLAQVSREAAARVLRKGAPGEAGPARTSYFRPPTGRRCLPKPHPPARRRSPMQAPRMRQSSRSIVTPASSRSRSSWSSTIAGASSTRCSRTPRSRAA